LKYNFFKFLFSTFFLLTLNNCWGNPIWQEILNNLNRKNTNSVSSISGLLSLFRTENSSTGPHYTIGGSVSGLTGSGLKLKNQTEVLEISASGNFVFTNFLSMGSEYEISVSNQPSNPSQICSVSNSKGTISDKNITDIIVVCSINSFTIGGITTGLLGTGLTLQNNSGDDLSISSNGIFTFSNPLADTSNYNVSVSSNPTSPAQICSASNNTGSVNGSNVENVSIICSTNSYTISGSISGLSGSGLVLRNNGGDDLAITNGATNFLFATSVADTQTYNVTVAMQPSSLTQNCVVNSGNGTVSGSNITGISIVCTTQSFSIGGTVTGFAGTTMTLQNNGGNDLSISTDGAFSFSNPLIDGSAYNVTVSTQPTGTAKICSINNGTGNLSNGNITNVAITCFAPTEVIGIELWLKADTLALGNGASVSIWNDSYSSNDAFQGTAANQPTFYTNSINGLPVVAFDGVNDYMQGNAFTVSNNTIFIVARFYQQSTNNLGIFSFFPASGNDWNNNDGFAITYKDNSATLIPKYERQIGADSFIVESSTNAGFHLLSLNFGSGTGSIYLDGSTSFTDAFAPISPSVMPSYYVIGARPPVGGFYGHTDFAEIIIYSAKLINNERERIECYLKAKYNLTSVNNSFCN